MLTVNGPYLRIVELAGTRLLVVALALLCVHLHFVEGLSSEDFQADQKIFFGPGSHKSQHYVDRILNVPVQRRLVEFHGRYYFLNISVGQPAQSLELFLDTGSSDTWVYDDSYCDDSKDNQYQCYHPERSKTSEVIPGPPYFEPRYPGLKFSGLYVKDAFAIGTTVLKKAEFGMLHDGKGPTGGGLLALSFDTSEFRPNRTFGYVYPSILDTIYNESFIDSRVFGLFLNNGSADEAKTRGSLVLGGYDRSKFSDPLLTFSIASPSDVKRISVPLIEIAATISSSIVPIWTARSDIGVSSGFVPAALDSGDMMAAIPAQAHATLLEHLNRYRNGMLKVPKTGEAFDKHIGCQHSSADVSVDFTFMGLTAPLTIKVPFSELVLPSPWGGDCWFALQPKPKNINSPYWLNLGSSILGSMYMIMDYDQEIIQLARARYDGGAVDIVPINHRAEN